VRCSYDQHSGSEEETLGRVREFRSKDIDRILEIEAEAFPKTACPKEVLLLYASRLSESFLVFEAEAGIVAYIIYDSEGHIISMAVKTSHRRNGIGTELLRHALRNVESLWLEVRSKNYGAIRFYEKMGMRAVGKANDYYDGDDALIMVLNEKNERWA
jgi:ribosomal-protein-alanine acetyltransferase